MSTSKPQLSPRMRIYARLVRAYRDWQLQGMTCGPILRDDDVQVKHRILNRIEAAKRALDRECGGGMGLEYRRLWASAKEEGEALAREEMWKIPTGGKGE